MSWKRVIDISLITGNRRFLSVLFCPQTIQTRTAVKLGTENRVSRNKRGLLQKVHLDRNIYISAYWQASVFISAFTCGPWIRGRGRSQRDRRQSRRVGDLTYKHWFNSIRHVTWKLLDWDYFCLQHFLSVQSSADGSCHISH